MKNRTPLPRDERPALPALAPVPRQCKRHDGWTPERQRAFIEALADTGSVATAARMVNMSSESAYALRRHPQAAGLAAAWEAALAMDWRRLKDEAVERALNGQLVPVFTASKLIGYRRQKNDRLLMFILRHYGPDGPAPTARPLTVNVINATATATASNLSLPLAGVSGRSCSQHDLNRPGDGLPDTGRGERAKRSELMPPDMSPHALPVPAQPFVSSEVETPTPDPRDTVATFAGVSLDDKAQDQIVAALTANAAPPCARDRSRKTPPSPSSTTVTAPAAFWARWTAA